jgi:hypothetical protein
MRLPTLVVLGSLCGLVSTAAVASHKNSEALGLIDDARYEAQALEGLIENSAPKRMERKLLRRLSKLEDILDSLEGELRDQEGSRGRAQRRGQSRRNDNFDGMIIVEDLQEMPVELPTRRVNPDDYFFEENAEISSREVKKILSTMDSESFSDGRLDILRSATKRRILTVAQVKQLMEAFPFGDDKVTAAAMLFPQVTDTENWYTVYAALDFDSDRKALRAKTGI